MLPPISEDLPRTGSRGSDAAGDSHSQDQYYHLSYADILYHWSSIIDLRRDSPVRHGMVRPCSSPASDRSWQGAAKTRSTPCLRNLVAQSPWLASISARTHSTSWTRSAWCDRAAAEVVARPGGNATCQPAAVSGRYGGLRRRASSQPQAAATRPQCPIDAGQIRAAV
jgi:hypothetical protein